MLKYIDTQSTDAAFNLAAEYYIATQRPDLTEGGDSVFLLWRTVPTLMLGKFQNVYEEINLPYAREHGTDIIRRMSGGGTIYTDMGGAQYTFITRGADEICFDLYTRPIVAAISALGAAVELSGRNDLTIEGKKFSGNAQYKIGAVTVHHGSLLFDTDIDALTAATMPRREKLTSKSIKSVRERVTNIAPHTPSVRDTGEFMTAVIDYINADTHAVFTQQEKDAITKLMPLIRADDVIFCRRATFTAQSSARFAGGYVCVSYNVKDGKIADAELSGDFFCAIDIHAVENALIGIAPTEAAVNAALLRSGQDNALFRVNAQNIASLFISDSAESGDNEI